MKWMITLPALLFVLTGFSSAPQDTLLQKIVNKADAAYKNRAEKGQSEKAIKYFKKAIALDSKCVEAYWKIARVYYSIGPDLEDGAEREAVYKEAINYCKKAVSIDKESIESHFWLGVMYGMFGQEKGIMQSLDLVDPLKKEMEWVIKKNPKFQEGGPYRLLGRLYFKLPGFKGGSNEKAVEHLKKSIELGPEHILGRIYLAEVYIDMDKKAEAKQLLETVLQMKNHPDWIPEFKKQKKQAKELMESMS